MKLSLVDLERPVTFGITVGSRASLGRLRIGQRCCKLCVVTFRFCKITSPRKRNPLLSLSPHWLFAVVWRKSNPFARGTNQMEPIHNIISVQSHPSYGSRECDQSDLPSPRCLLSHLGLKLELSKYNRVEPGLNISTNFFFCSKRYRCSLLERRRCHVPQERNDFS